MTSVNLQLASPGRWGCAVNGYGDLEAVLKDIPLENVGIGISAGSSFHRIWSYLTTYLEAQNTSPKALRIALNADPLGDLVAIGETGEPLEDQFKRMVSCTEYALATLPNATVLCADGQLYHEAGASEAQELAAMLASAVTYMRALEKGGLCPEFALAQTRFKMAADSDLFLTIAKLRAARLLIARVAEMVGAEEAVPRITLAVQTSERMMTKYDAHVNMLRTTVACAGAALGGANSVTVLPYSWVRGAADTLARRIARNTQLILRDESGLGRVTDPSGGAWYLENLANALAAKAWDLFAAIDAQGGMQAALETGFIQDTIKKTAAQRGDQITHGKLEITGTSVYPDLSENMTAIEPHPAPLALDASVAKVEPLRPTAYPSHLKFCVRRAKLIAKRRVIIPKCSLPRSAQRPISPRARDLPRASSLPAVSKPTYRTPKATLTASWTLFVSAVRARSVCVPAMRSTRNRRPSSQHV